MLSITHSIQNVNTIIPININKYYYEFINSDILFKMLSEEYQPLTYNYFSVLIRENIENFNINKPIIKNNILSVKNNYLNIDKYLLLPISKGYQFGVLSPLYYYYLNIINDLPINSNCVIVQVIGPWEIKNKTLNLYFELEDILIKHRKCIIKTIFILIGFGEDIKYDNINYDKTKEYIIIDINNIKEFDKISKFIKNTDNILVDNISIYSKTFCQNELATLPLLIILYDKLLKTLNKNGNFYINSNSFYLYQPTIQLLYYIFIAFNDVKFLNNILITENIGFIKYINLQNYKNDLDGVIKEYIKLDSYLGQNTLVKSNSLYCLPNDKNKNKPNIEFVIKTIMKINVSHKFIDFLLESYKSKNKIIKNQLLKIDLMKKHLDLDMILSNNIGKSIELCNDLNIEINDMYLSFKILSCNKVIDTYFPHNNNIDTKKLDIAIDSIYSITKPKITEEISKYIKKEFPTINFIIDGTSNVGTTAIVLSYHFKYIYAIEINDTTYLKLKNNVEVYKLKNVKCILDDVMKFMNDKNKLKEINFDINTFCLFLDPPWKGVFYKTEKQIDLELGTTNVLDFIKIINIKYVCMKVPFNYNFSKLYKYFYNITITRLSGFYVVLISK